MRVQYGQWRWRKRGRVRWRNAHSDNARRSAWSDSNWANDICSNPDFQSSDSIRRPRRLQDTNKLLLYATRHRDKHCDETKNVTLETYRYVWSSERNPHFDIDQRVEIELRSFTHRGRAFSYLVTDWRDDETSHWWSHPLCIPIGVVLYRMSVVIFANVLKNNRIWRRLRYWHTTNTSCVDFDTMWMSNFVKLILDIGEDIGKTERMTWLIVFGLFIRRLMRLHSFIVRRMVQSIHHQK